MNINIKIEDMKLLEKYSEENIRMIDRSIIVGISCNSGFDKAKIE